VEIVGNAKQLLEKVAQKNLEETFRKSFANTT